MRNQKRVAVLVLGYNSQKYLNDCFTSIRSLRPKNYITIFIDNNSKDNSIQFIQDKFPEVKIIRNNKNLGYAAGYNVGIKEVIKNKVEYVFLLNPDTIVKINCLQELLKKANDRMILQPLILLYSHGRKTSLINTSGNHLHYSGISYCGDYRKKKETVQEKDITSASGSAIFIPVSILRKIGRFDEEFFMYHEDLDFCWRARLAGYNIRLIPKAIVWHKYHFSRNRLKLFYEERNRLFFIFKNYQIKTLILISPMLILNELLVLIFSLFNGWLIIKIKSLVFFMMKFDHVTGFRKKIERFRKVNDDVLKKYFSPEILFSEVQIPALKFYNLLSKGFWFLIKRFI